MGKKKTPLSTETQSVNWKSKRTEETRQIEQLLRSTFPKTDAYRYNIASIRIRIIDDRFEGRSAIERDQMVDPLLDQLPDETQSDIMLVLKMTPEESKARFNKYSLVKFEFENPSPSGL